MAESIERKPAQKRLSKQNEIDDEEDGEDNSPSSDQSDTTLTAGPDTPGLQSSPESPTQREVEVQEDEGSEFSNTQEEEDDNSDEQHSKSHSYSNSKGNKLQRSQALTEDDSPPPDESAGGDCATSKHKQGKSPRGKLEKTGSGSMSSEAGTSSSLSRDSSTDVPYTDSSGIDLEEFIKMTLNRTPKDRQMLLQLERDLLNFIQTPDHDYLKFPPMSSYNRMLVHRIAAFFGLDHNVDQTGKAVIVNKTSNTRVPEFNFGDHIRGNGGSAGPLEVRKLLKRDGMKGGDKPHLNNDKRTKSLEERQYDYNQARARIFQQQDSERSSSDQPDCLMGKRPDSLSNSKEDIRWREMRPWSSTDSSGYSTDSSFKGRQPMTKASSFGGVPSTIMTRPPFKGQCVSITDSLSSGISSLGSPMTRPPAIPSSPGNQSDASILSGSSSSGPIYSPPQPIIIEGNNNTLNPPSFHHMSGGSGGGHSGGQQQIYWVASNADSVAPGSIIINPQTGQPYVNGDGTLYRYNPNQPIPGSPSTPSEPHQPHPAYPQPTVIPIDRPTYVRDGSGGSRDLCQQMSSFTVSAAQNTEGVIETNPATPHTPVMYPSIHHSQSASHPQTQVLMQQSYYPGSQSSTSGSQVRYMYPVSYMGSNPGQGQIATSMEGQPHQNSNISQTTGPYPSQSYVVPYSSGYQTITYQQIPCQSSDSFQPTAYPPSVTYPSAPADSVSHYTTYHSNHQLYNSQPTNYVPQQGPQGPIYYTVPTSSPQSTFAFSTQGSFRPSTPPNQGSVPGTNQSLPMNLGQGVTITTPAPPTQPPGNSVNLSSPHYFQYPAFPQLPVSANHAQSQHIVPYSSLAQSAGGHAVPMVRPNMQISMQYPNQGATSLTGNMQQSITSPAGHCAIKGFMFEPRLPKSPEVVRDGGSASVLVGAGYSMGPSPALPPVRPGAGGPFFRPPNPVNTAEVRLYGQPMTASIRSPIQPLQFQQRLPSPQAACNLSLNKSLRGNRRVGKVPSKDGVPFQVTSQGELPKGSHVLEVCDFPAGLTQSHANKLLEDITGKGATIQYFPRNKSVASFTENTPASDLTVLAIFSSGSSANQFLQTYSNPSFTLRSTLHTDTPSITRPE